ncbi:MAG: PAS domain S-box protein, partial [Bacteroidota bacterium]
MSKITELEEKCRLLEKENSRLRKSQHRSLFMEFFNQSTEGMLLMDLEGNIIDWNNSMQQLTGIEKKYVLFEKIWNIDFELYDQAMKNHELYKDLKNKNIQYLSSKVKKRYSYEVQVFTRDKKLKFFQVTVFPIDTAEGIFIGRITRDFTEKMTNSVTLQEKIQEKTTRLKESEANYKMLFDEAADGILVINHTGKIKQVNKSTCNITGYSRQELEDKNLHDLFLPQDLAKKPIRLDLVIKGINVLSKNTLIKKNGQPVSVEKNSSLMPDGKILVFVRDISERDISEQALQQAADIVESIQTGLYIYWIEDLDDDYSLRLISANPASEKILGLPRDEIINKKIDEIFPNLRKKNIPKLFAEVIKKQKLLSFEYFTYEDNIIKNSIFSFNAFPLPNQQVGVSFENITQRKKAENQLKIAEETYRNLFMNSQVGLFRTLVSGERFLEANDMLAKLFGYKSRNAFLEDKPNVWNVYVDSEDRKTMLKSLLSEGEIRNFETRMKNKNGQEFWVRYSGNLNRQNQWLDGVLEDITEKKEYELALVDKNLELEQIFNAIPDTIIFVDKNRKIVKTNLGFSNLFGYHPGEVTGKSSEIIYKYFSDFQEQGKIRYNIHAIDIQHPYEMTYRKKNGLTFIGETIGTQVRNNKGEVVGLMARIRDITEKKQNEKALKESEQKFRNIFDNSMDAIMIINPENQKIIEANKTFYDVTNYLPSQIKGLDIKTLTNKKDADLINLRVKKLINKKHVGSLELDINTGKKGVLNVEINSRLINYEGKKAILTIARDISERKALERKVFDSMIEAEEKERKRLA